MIKKITVIIFTLGFLYNLFADENDKNIQTIKKYYNYLENKDTVKKAYEMSPKKVDFDTFNKWYKDVSKIYLINIKKINTNNYRFIVFLTDKKNKTSTFDVTFEIKNGKILSSKSKQIKYYIEKEIPFKDNKKIVIINNADKSSRHLYLADKNMENMVEIINFSYDEFGNSIECDLTLGDFIFFNYTAFDFFTRYVYDVNNKKLFEMPFDNIYVSPDKNYVVAYGEAGMSTIEGTRLITFFNKYYGIDMKPGESMKNVELQETGNKKYIVFKNNKGNELRKIEIKK